MSASLQEIIEAKAKACLLDHVKKRNAKESSAFAKVIKFNNKLFEINVLLKSELTELKIANQKLEKENIELLKNPGSAQSSNANSSTISYTHEKARQLDEQLLKAKDEVIDLQKRLVDQANQIILLNKQLKEKTDELTLKDARLSETEARLENLRTVNRELEKAMSVCDENIKLWKDEKVESEMQFNCLLQKYEKLKEEYNHVLAASLRFKEEQIEKVNKLNELESERLQHKLREELEKAIQPTTDNMHLTQMNNHSMIPMGASAFVNYNTKGSPLASLPLINRPVCRFDCHDGEVNSVKYHKSGKYFATGGGDRKIKLWEYKDGKCDQISCLIGSNAAIASIDMEYESNLIAGTSFDFACRLWSLNEQRLKMSSGDIQPTHTLTGHTNKVLSGKFLSGLKIVTGSYDRTLKVWDLMQKACIKTLFAGSSCNDLVTVDSQSIISGHFDKKIRFWDVRADPPQSEILLQGKITSLDLSSNKNYLLASIRDVNVLKMIDIRMNQVTETYCCEEFKVSSDWARAVFSPDLDQKYVCAGSADGSLIIWNSITAKVEKVIKEHNASVSALSWHPKGDNLVTADSKKRAIIWSFM